MLYTNNTVKAMNLMFERHQNQRDKLGVPYVFHPFHVAEQMDDEDSTVVALLHDIVEDTNTTFEELEQMGFKKEVIDALHLLTHKEGVDYFDYVEELSKNPLATKVKLADLEHNMDPTRIKEMTEKDVQRREKYQKAYTFLQQKNKEKKQV